MCLMMSIIAMKSEYISCANKVYNNLQEVENIFEKEAYVLSYVKCLLLKEEELDDFYINGINVNAYEISNGYELCFDGIVMNIETYDKQIINFEISK